MNRAANAGILDANSQLPASCMDSALINTNATTSIIVGQGMFRGFLVVGTGSGAHTGNLYDVSTTAAAGLVSTNCVGVLNSTTATGAVPFQWGGDIIYSNGLVYVSAGGTAAAVKILYL